MRKKKTGSDAYGVRTSRRATTESISIYVFPLLCSPGDEVLIPQQVIRSLIFLQKSSTRGWCAIR